MALESRIRGPQDRAHNASENAAAVALFAGKTISAVEAITSYDRTEVLVFSFSDGSQASVGYWAQYADDGSLEFGAVDA